jgi:hypothetical protein
MRKPEKADKLINYLEEQLLAGLYTAGSRIPSVRRLSAKFGLTYSSALRGVDYLCDKGVLEKSPNRGIYVKNYSPATSANPTACTVAILIPPHMAGISAGIYHTTLRGMQQLAIRMGVSLKLIPTAFETVSNTTNLQELCGDCKGVIMLHEYDEELNSTSINLPAVGIMMHNNFGGRISIVDLDPFNAAESAVSYFMKRAPNLRKAVVVSSYHFSCATHSTYVNRGRTFSQYWQNKGMDIEDFIIVPYNEIMDIEYRSDCAYLFTSDSLLQSHSVAYQEKNGTFLADDHIVLGLDGKNLIDPDFHNFPSVALDWEIVGEYALEECIYRINNPGAKTKRIYLNGIINTD